MIHQPWKPKQDIDGERIARHAAIGGVEAAEDTREVERFKRTSDRRFVDKQKGGTKTFFDPKRQWGSPIGTNQFVKRLNTISRVPIVGEVHPDPAKSATVECLYALVGDQKVFIYSVPRPIIPEFGQRTPYVEKLGTTKTHIKEPDEPLWSEEITSWNETLGGWRTALVKFIDKRMVPTDAAEREFGLADTPGWAFHTGKMLDQGELVA